MIMRIIITMMMMVTTTMIVVGWGVLMMMTTTTTMMRIMMGWVMMNVSLDLREQLPRRLIDSHHLFHHLEAEGDDDDNDNGHNDNHDDDDIKIRNLLIDGKSWRTGAVVRTRGVNAQVRAASVVF